MEKQRMDLQYSPSQMGLTKPTLTNPFGDLDPAPGNLSQA